MQPKPRMSTSPNTSTASGMAPYPGPTTASPQQRAPIVPPVNAPLTPDTKKIGHVRIVTLFGHKLFISPDLAMWIMPTGITTGLFIGVLLVAGHIPKRDGMWEFYLLWLLFLGICGASIACGLTDPGFIPLPVAEEGGDPYSNRKDWIYCQRCHIRRPPRAAHCYTCGMCVLEHDHHCGVIGGCVGMRSLRWFALYLTITSLACIHGFTWVLRSLMGGRSKIDVESTSLAMHIMLLVMIGNVILLVGGLAIYYIYLLASDQTRREAQGKKTTTPGSYAAHLYYYEERMQELHNRWSWKNLGHFGKSVNPPPSLILEQMRGHSLTTVRADDGVTVL